MTATFDCNRYEEYMRLLLEIAQMTEADAELIGDNATSVGYLKPFERNRNVKWDETFFRFETFTRGGKCRQ